MSELEKAGKMKMTPSGKWTILAPYSVSKVEQAIACLRLVQKLQHSRKTSPNTSELSRDYALLDQAREKYNRSLVGGILRAEYVQKNADRELTHGGRDQSANGTAINHYMVAEHIRCLLYAWRQPINQQSIMIRDHFALAARHSMLLRDENMRNLDLSDCAVDRFVKQPGGTQEVIGMLFTMRGGKTDQRGTPQLA